ncbi:T9SS type A sorting domain-containing protein [uncultured Algibacter sp.]|uniref:T9SS type A sorting domain-containing protein n=1 Tax=uncultured Algibacter sp. TaxID=298659 RepID=UPI00262AF9AB|nr:T9SS type A sorting domain-containing protein [uncultured Algibacter sp.]
MKKITLLIVVLLAFNFGYGQTKIAELTFESAGGYTTNDSEFTDGSQDYFLRTDGSNILNEDFFNQQGSYYFAAQDTSPTSAILPLTLLLDDVNINSYTSLEFRIHLAEDDLGTNQHWDDTDFVHINYDIDNSGTFTDLLWIEGSGGTNTEPLIDTNFDGTGDGTAITSTFTQFIENIPGTGSLLDIEIEFRLNAGGEDIAVDNIEIWGVLSCPTTTTWTAGAWDNGIPTNNVNAVIDDNYNTSTDGGSFSACSLTINATNRLTVDNGAFVEVEKDVVVNGELYVETQGNFVQNDNSGTFVGVGRVNKQTASKAAWYYYTYWSSPVIGETLWSVFPDVDYGRRFWFDAANFVDTNGDNVNDNTLPDWKISDGTMDAGVGYAVAESQFFIPGIGIANFEGQFNTGDITTNIAFNIANTGTYWNLIGNPYPSAIDFIAFQQANSSMVNGVAYFWSQASPPDAANPGNEGLNFNQNDYATYTVGTGGAAGASGVTPDQFIPSGQSFFIAGLGNGNVTFTNAMRMADGTSNNQFFKNTKSKKTSSNIANKLWVNLTSDNGVFNQILVGYVDGATDLNDGMSYDAQRLLKADFSATLYSSIEDSNEKFAVQGKAPESLAEDEIISLGYSTNIDVATLYKLSIAQLQGAFLTENDVYLKDNLLNTVHNLSDSDYTFTSEVGEFNDRFEIHFNSSALSTEDIDANSNTLKIVELEDDAVRFTASGVIKTVSVFDLLGRQLYQFEGHKTSETYKLSNLSSSVYIAKVTLLNGTTITKKAFKK